MSAENTWREYADENYAVALLALEGGYYNACLQNVQQAIEKYMKAILITQGIGTKKTHNIELLNQLLYDAGIETDLSNDDCELLDSVYIPSKYPTGSVLPDFSPDEEICRQCIEMVEKLRKSLF